MDERGIKDPTESFTKIADEVTNSTKKVDFPGSTKQVEITESTEQGEVTESTKQDVVVESTKRDKVNESTKQNEVAELTKQEVIIDSTRQNKVAESTKQDRVTESTNKNEAIKSTKQDGSDDHNCFTESTLNEGSQTTAEEKKNSQNLQELIRLSHPHVHKYLHLLQDPTGAIIFPEDPKQLNQMLRTHERKIRKNTTKEQQKLLFPDGLNETDSRKFDLTLFKWLIVNFGQTNKPKKFWQEEPLEDDSSDEANISRLFFNRNCIQHGTGYVSDNKYKKVAADVINALISLGEDEQNLQNLLPPVQYGLSKPVSNYFGRTEDLNKIHEVVLNGWDNIVHVVVHGMTGLGKSETIRKYCHVFGDCFGNHILWINAANQTSLESSFKEIAGMVGLVIKDGNGDLKEINSIVKSVHKHFQSERILYVFDDVTNIQSLTPFLPKHNRAISIITTQLTDWPQNHDFQMHELQTFEETEGKSFLDTNLKDKKLDEKQLNRSLKQLGGHPLALQQFVVAITKTMLSVEEYLDLLEKKTAKILEAKLTTMQGGKSVIGAIRITSEKLAETEDSKLALDILNTISYFYGDEISFEVLKLTFPGYDVIDIENAVQKLESYSLIKRNNIILISIHSLVQKSMISQHKRSSDEYFQVCLKMFKNQLKVDEVKSNHESFGKEWYKHLIYFLSANFCKTEVHHLLFGKREQILNTLRTKGGIPDLIEFYNSLLKTLTETNGPSDEKVISTMWGLAECYRENGQFDEAIELFQNVCDEQIKLHGNTHKTTLRAMNNLAGCFLYTRTESDLDKAIIICEKVLDEYIKLHGKNHKSTLKMMGNLAGCFRDKERLDDAIKMYEEILVGFKEIHGEKHPYTLRTLNWLAVCFKEKGELDEAIKLFENVLERRIQLYGKRHPSTLRTISWLASCFKDVGRFNEAKELLMDALTISKSSLGEHHPQTGILKKHLLQVENEALKEHCVDETEFDVSNVSQFNVSIEQCDGETEQGASTK